ncbi:hypothetical protein FA95DRAFT_1220279 [Auriscalpium vulgare]|uniref:Uncharacterized protein n=1 Tax=Auriscalpium vulgare TaxID=40419 RepID=A0ACB8RU51_9AGAM|nr:hypothetical protein FA95DRAFT_1220279 [Auriscalpium vulgare]
MDQWSGRLPCGPDCSADRCADQRSERASERISRRLASHSRRDWSSCGGSYAIQAGSFVASWSLFFPGALKGDHLLSSFLLLWASNHRCILIIAHQLLTLESGALRDPTRVSGNRLLQACRTPNGITSPAHGPLIDIASAICEQYHMVACHPNDYSAQ